MEEKDKKNLRNQQPSLEDLIDIKEWQKIQDNFATITGVRLRTVGFNGDPITAASREPRLCSELMKDSRLKGKVCGICLPTFLGGREVVDKNLSFICQAGLYNFVTPLRAEGQVFGYLTVGPVILVMRKPKEQYRKTAEELNLDLEDFWGAVLELKVISFQGAQSLVELIKNVGEYTIKLAYQNIMSKKEMAMTPDSPKLSRILEVLLDVAFQIAGADIGSIMFFDKGKRELTIRASKGIPEEIVRRTKVRLGEGISGIAVKERTSFLIDDNLRDNRISTYLNRPYIGSSMVLPIEMESTVCGVMNLGALRTSPVRFNTGNVKLIERLIDLATLVIAPAS